MTTKPAVYTLQDLSRLTGLRPGTLRQWKLRGKLPAPSYTMGQSPAWTGKAIEEWLTSNPRAGAQFNRKTPEAS